MPVRSVQRPHSVSAPSTPGRGLTRSGCSAGVGVTSVWQTWTMPGCQRFQSRINVGFPGVHRGVKLACEGTSVMPLPGRSEVGGTGGAGLFRDPPPLSNNPCSKGVSPLGGAFFERRRNRAFVISLSSQLPWIRRFCAWDEAQAQGRRLGAAGLQRP